MYPKKGIFVFLLCTIIYVITAKIIIQGGFEVLFNAISVELFIILVYIISPIYMIRYYLAMKKDNIISIEVVFAVATFLSIIIYNNILIYSYESGGLIEEIFKQGLYLEIAIKPVFKNATFTIIIFLLINIIMEKKINSSEIRISKQLVIAGIIYMILLTIYTVGADLVLEKIRYKLLEYTPENLYYDLIDRRK